MVEDEPAVPAPGAAGPVVAVERVGADADLGGQVPDHRRGEVGLVVGKAAVLAPVGELRGQAELAGVGQVGQQRQVLGAERPALAKLVRRPLPLHRRRPHPVPGQAGYGSGTASVTLLGQNAQLRGHWAKQQLRVDPAQSQSRESIPNVLLFGFPA